MSGDVSLKDISGGALVETMNGEISVSVKSLADSKPLSFTSMRGEISIHLPQESKANIRFRTHRGVILTNFDDKALVTKTESSSRSVHSERMKDKEKDDAMAPVAAVGGHSARSAPTPTPIPTATGTPR